MYKTKHRFFKLIAVCCLILAVACLIMPTTYRQMTGDCEVTFLDVGQGDSIFISADGYNVLIDAGGLPTDSTAMAENVVIPYLKSLGISKLDVVFNTHPDNDHIGGIFAVLDEVDVDYLALYEGYAKNKKQNQLLKLAEQDNVTVLAVSAGEEFNFSDNFKITVLSPEEGAYYESDEVNNGSLVLHISYQDFDILTTGDLVGDDMMNAIKNLDCDDIEILQLPHHGSKYSYNEDWYGEFDPEAVMISVGIDNDYGHPGQKVIDYWEDRGVAIYRTDLYGSCRATYKNGKLSFDTAA
jgi:competence protein ComEC